MQMSVAKRDFSVDSVSFFSSATILFHSFSTVLFHHEAAKG